jgi:hypothetical protein
MYTPVCASSFIIATIDIAMDISFALCIASHRSFTLPIRFAFPSNKITDEEILTYCHKHRRKLPAPCKRYKDPDTTERELPQQLVKTRRRVLNDRLETKEKWGIKVISQALPTGTRSEGNLWNESGGPKTITRSVIWT